jgi:excisionase family DNA binding protein
VTEPASSSSLPDPGLGKMPTEDRLLDAGEVAELLSVPERWVREHTRGGKLPHVRLGRYLRYDRADLLAWVDEQKSGGAAIAFRRHRPLPSRGTK